MRRTARDFRRLPSPGIKRDGVCSFAHVPNQQDEAEAIVGVSSARETRRAARESGRERDRQHQGRNARAQDEANRGGPMNSSRTGRRRSRRRTRTASAGCGQQVFELIALIDAQQLPAPPSVHIPDHDLSRHIIAVLQGYPTPPTGHFVRRAPRSDPREEVGCRGCRRFARRYLATDVTELRARRLAWRSPSADACGGRTRLSFGPLAWLTFLVEATAVAETRDSAGGGGDPPHCARHGLLSQGLTKRRVGRSVPSRGRDCRCRWTRADSIDQLERIVGGSYRPTDSCASVAASALRSNLRITRVPRGAADRFDLTGGCPIRCWRKS